MAVRIWVRLRARVGTAFKAVLSNMAHLQVSRFALLEGPQFLSTLDRIPSVPHEASRDINIHEVDLPMFEAFSEAADMIQNALKGIKSRKSLNAGIDEED